MSQPNDPNRLLRNGLAVTGFNLLEDFIKLRTAELLKEISGGSLAFTQLPDKLQRACTETVVKALRYQIGIVRKRDSEQTARALIANTGSELASTAGGPLALSALAFGHGAANIDSEEVSSICSALGVEAGWQTIAELTTTVGFTIAQPSVTYTEAMQRRHDAAHDAAHDTPLGDLRTYWPQALVIACAFDIVVTRSAYELRLGNLAALPVTASSVPVYLVEGEPALTLEARGNAALVSAEADGGAVIHRFSEQMRSWTLTDLEGQRR